MNETNYNLTTVEIVERPLLFSVLLILFSYCKESVPSNKAAIMLLNKSIVEFVMYIGNEIYLLLLENGRLFL